jgi:hypothetical protein
MPSTAAISDHGIIAKMMGFNALIHAAIDWPLRRLLFNRVGCKTIPVQANKAAYDAEQSEQLWNMSTKLVGLKQ